MFMNNSHHSKWYSILIVPFSGHCLFIIIRVVYFHTPLQCHQFSPFIKSFIYFHFRFLCSAIIPVFYVKFLLPLFCLRALHFEKFSIKLNVSINTHTQLHVSSIFIIRIICTYFHSTIAYAIAFSCLLH